MSLAAAGEIESSPAEDRDATHRLSIHPDTLEQQIEAAAAPTYTTGPELTLAAAEGRANDSDEAYWLDRALELEESLAGAEDDQRRIQLLLEIGSIWQHRLHDRDSAVAAFERVMELDPANRWALPSLCRLYELEWDTDKLIGLLIGCAEHTDNPAERAELLRRVAELYEQLGQTDNAALVLEAAVETQPDRRTLVVRLKALKAGQQQPGVVAAPAPVPRAPAPAPRVDPIDLLEERLEQTEDRDEQVEVYEQLAALWLRRPNQSGRAIQCLERALQLDPRRESTYEQLEQIHSQQQHYDELARVLERHAETADPSNKPEVYFRLARILEGPVDQPARALDVYRELRTLDPSHGLGLERLARLAQRMEAWGLAIEALRDQTKLARTPQQTADLLHEIGSIQQYYLSDVDAAEQTYEQALEVAAAHSSTIAQLLELYRLRRDWAKATLLLRKAAEASDSPKQRADLVCEAGTIAFEHLSEPERAMALLKQALELDPDRASAARPLAEVYYRQGQYQDAEPLLELLLRKTEPDDTEALSSLRLRLAEICAQSGRTQGALEHAMEARRIDPSDRQTTHIVADLLFLNEAWEDAQTAYEELLDDDAEVKVETLWRLSFCARKLGDTPRAIEGLETLLRRQPDHEPSLQALAELRAAAEDWSAVVAAKSKLVDSTENKDDRRELCMELGDIHWKQLDDPDQAETYYKRVVDLDNEDRPALNRLLDLYSALERWRETIAICERLADIETEPKVRAKYYNAAAVICRDKLEQTSEAIAFYNKCLDADPRRIKAFREIDDLCSKNKDWRTLEHNYGKMIARLPKSGFRKLRVRLWRNLAEILRTNRRDFEGAIAAYEAAAALEPHSRHVHEMLADLYLRAGEKYRDRGFKAQHLLIQLSPDKPEPYRALRRLCMKTKRYDNAWCLSCALTFMNKAEDEEVDYYKQYKPRALLRATAQTTDEAWRTCLYHPGQDQRISAVFALMVQPVASTTARPHADFGLKRRDRRDPATDTHRVSRILNYATGVLNVALADVFFKSNDPSGMVLAHTSEAPSFVIGDHLLRRSSSREIAFIVGRQLTFLRPEHFLRYALATPAHLEAAWLAAQKITNPDIAVPGRHTKIVNRIVKLARRHMPPTWFEQLAATLASDKSHDDDCEILRWWNATELTADRVALLICNDLDVAARMIGAEPTSGGIDASERIKQLIQFMCSPQYFQLREQLELTIDRQVG